MFHSLGTTLLIFYVQVALTFPSVVKQELTVNLHRDWHVYTSYTNTPYCAPDFAPVYPRNVLDIQLLILRASYSRIPVKVYGSRHSIVDHICTDGIPVAMDNFHHMRLNPDKTVTIGAGTKLGHALLFLEANGLTIKQIPQYQGITIAGALGTGAHGSSLGDETLADQTVAMKLVDGLGVIRILTGKELDIARVHLGMLGIITEVTLKTVPLFKMKQFRTLESESILFDGTAMNYTLSSDGITLCWFPNQRKVVVIPNWVLDNVNTPGDAVSTLYPDTTSEISGSLKATYDILNENRDGPGLAAFESYNMLSLYTKVIGRVPIITEDFQTLSNPAIGYGWKLTTFNCTTCYWTQGDQSFIMDDNEFGVDLSQFHGTVKTLRNILDVMPASFPVVGIVFRFSPPSKALLAQSYGRKDGIVNVEFIYPQRMDNGNQGKYGQAAYQAMQQALVNKHGGRPHWGKNGLHWFTTQEIEKMIPADSLHRFRSAMRKYDPLGIFLNKFGKRLLGVGNEMDVNPKNKRCAVNDVCICQSDLDCSDEQFCSYLEDIDRIHVYRVCRDRDPKRWDPVGNYDPRNMTDIFRAVFSRY